MTNHRRIVVSLGIAAALALALYLDMRASEPSAATNEETTRASARTFGAPPKTPLPSRAEFLRMLAAAQAEQHERAKELDHDHPHPITTDHQRLYRDVDLLHAADEAIKAAQYDQARALLAQHHRELGGMSAVEEEGLWLLADCAEHSNAENVERVRSFYEEHRDSTVRRRLRRACLELAQR
jgi:pyruvate/2-oxoglutarate dehydrogenase complex dihydrolipoamide acyltransferase (E2) component